jgi:hypothetical protein
MDTFKIIKERQERILHEILFSAMMDELVNNVRGEKKRSNIIFANDL